MLVLGFKVTMSRSFFDVFSFSSVHDFSLEIITDHKVVSRFVLLEIKAAAQCVSQNERF